MEIYSKLKNTMVQSIHAHLRQNACREWLYKAKKDRQRECLAVCNWVEVKREGGEGRCEAIVLFDGIICTSQQWKTRYH